MSFAYYYQIGCFMFVSAMVYVLSLLLQVSSHQSNSKPQGSTGTSGPPGLSWASTWASSRWGTPSPVSPRGISGPLQWATTHRALPA